MIFKFIRSGMFFDKFEKKMYFLIIFQKDSKFSTFRCDFFIEIFSSCQFVLPNATNTGKILHCCIDGRTSGCAGPEIEHLWGE
jgi:hypothetical protein